MWDWQRSVVLPLVLQGFARSVGRQAGVDGQAATASAAMLQRYFDWARASTASPPSGSSAPSR
jgi:hypothetical protein